MKLKKNSRLLNVLYAIIGLVGYNAEVFAQRLNCICYGNNGKKIESHAVTSNVTSDFKSCADFVGTAGAESCVDASRAKSR